MHKVSPLSCRPVVNLTCFLQSENDYQREWYMSVLRSPGSVFTIQLTDGMLSSGTLLFPRW